MSNLSAEEVWGLELELMLDDPKTHQAVLGEYAGSYSLGVANDHFLLRVPDNSITFPSEVIIDGHPIVVEVRRGYEPAVPQGS